MSQPTNNINLVNLAKEGLSKVISNREALDYDLDLTSQWKYETEKSIEESASSKQEVVKRVKVHDAYRVSSGDMDYWVGIEYSITIKVNVKMVKAMYVLDQYEPDIDVDIKTDNFQLESIYISFDGDDTPTELAIDDKLEEMGKGYSEFRDDIAWDVKQKISKKKKQKLDKGGVTSASYPNFVKEALGEIRRMIDTRKATDDIIQLAENHLETAYTYGMNEAESNIRKQKYPHK